MAKLKYFHIKNKETGAEYLVGAPREGLALSVITGSAKMVRAASDEDVAAIYMAGGKKHEKSSTEPSAKLFVIDVEPKILIAAKNAGDAFAAINEGVYESSVASQHALVVLLEKGIKPLMYVEPERSAKGSANAGAPAGDSQGENDGSVADGHIAGDGEVNDGAADSNADAEAVNDAADAGAASDGEAADAANGDAGQGDAVASASTADSEAAAA